MVLNVSEIARTDDSELPKIRELTGTVVPLVVAREAFLKMTKEDRARLHTENFKKAKEAEEILRKFFNKHNDSSP